LRDQLQDHGYRDGAATADNADHSKFENCVHSIFTIPLLGGGLFVRTTVGKVHGGAAKKTELVATNTELVTPNSVFYL